MAQTTEPADVIAFIDAIESERRREDCRTLLALMKTVVPNEKPRLWPGRIVGLGDWHYRYASGREGDTFLIGFSPRKAAVTLYLGPHLGEFESRLGALGTHTSGKGCLYLKSLADVDEGVLVELMRDAVAHLRRLAAS